MNERILPNEVIHKILLCCQSSADYFAQSLINRQWNSEAQRLKSLMKRRFARQITLLFQRSIIWDFDQCVTVIGYKDRIQQHGLEECVQTFHRVGGPGASVYYLQRSWEDGKLEGEEILREINSVWYNQGNENYRLSINESFPHPYDGLSSVDSVNEYVKKHPETKMISMPDGCDYFGQILFRHYWNGETTADSQKFERKVFDDEDQSCVDAMYAFVDRIDLSTIESDGNGC